MKYSVEFLITILYELDHFRTPPVSKFHWKKDSVAGPIFSPELFEIVAPIYRQRIPVSRFVDLIGGFIAGPQTKASVSEVISKKARLILEEYV